MRIFLKYLLFTGITLAFASCTKEEENVASLEKMPGWEYFPTDSGLTRIYRIDSVYWDPFSGIKDTVSYNLKEVIAGNFIDNQGQSAQRIERFRQDDQGNWVIYKVWSSLRNRQRAETVEDNIRLIKMVFPCTAGTRWNGNAYNTFGSKTYEVTACGIPGNSDFLNFNNTVTINQDDEPANLLNDRNDLEKYASTVGLYYRLNSFLEFNFLSGDTISGYIYTEKLISHYP